MSGGEETDRTRVDIEDDDNERLRFELSSISYLVSLLALGMVLDKVEHEFRRSRSSVSHLASSSASGIMRDCSEGAEGIEIGEGIKSSCASPDCGLGLGETN